MITLHYAEGKDLAKDIVEIRLKNTLELKSFLKGVISKDNKETVYLLTSDFSIDPEDEYNEYSREIFIESDPSTLYCAALGLFDYDGCVMHLQEYGSFEDAYKVALDMRESNQLCYNISKQCQDT